MKKLPQAVLFDHDGVLVNSEPIHVAAWGELLKEIDIPFNEPEIRAHVGRTAPEILEALLDLHRPGWDKAQYDVKDLSVRKNDFYLAKIKAQLKLFGGVQEGLGWLKSKRIKIAVVSNARNRELTSALRVLGILSLFDCVCSREETGKAKPDPTPYLYAAAAVGVDPKNCLAVEDSPPGLEAALMAKIPAAAVLTTFQRDALEAPVLGRPDLQPTWIGGSMHELFTWMKTLAPNPPRL
ncbi:HAD family phosphatase [bacterium]|jgi:HAD superfamily hydrolase (TIGR01509 family)|nr:HAD family phosphatase [bacterium]